MNQSRRSLFGFGAALATMAAIGTVKAAPVKALVVPIVPSPTPQPFVVGEIRQFFSHYEAWPVSNFGTTQFMNTNNPHQHSFTTMEAFTATEYKIWDGSEWVLLNSAPGQAVVERIRV